jgi:hypothetical protein
MFAYCPAVVQYVETLPLHEAPLPPVVHPQFSQFVHVAPHTPAIA